MCITSQNYLIDALDTVLNWGLPDSALELVLIEQAKLLSGYEAADVLQSYPDLLQ